MEMPENINFKKNDLKTKLNEIANDFLMYIKSEFPEHNNHFFNEINKGVYSLTNVTKPKVMVYGIYNSGKSTLINALCKEKVAEMGDRPITSKISEYDKGDYILVDSPGVDAPKEHEEVTEEFLNKCHIILFVMSSKGIFEDADNYRRLADLILKGIPFIIVLNDRGAAIRKDLLDEEKEKIKFNHEQDLKNIQHKIIQNLIKESHDNTIYEKYEVVIVNAKKALAGIEKNNQQLYDLSKVEFLNKRIIQTLNDSLKILFKQPIINLKNCIGEVEKIITQNMNGDVSEDFSMRMNTLEIKKNNIIDDLKILIKQTINSYSDDITNLYFNNNTNILERIISSIHIDIENHYTSKVNELLIWANKNFEVLHLHFDKVTDLNEKDEFDLFKATTSKVEKTNSDQSAKESNSTQASESDEMSPFATLVGSILPKGTDIFGIPKIIDSIADSLGFNNKKKEEEKRQRLEAEVEAQNKRLFDEALEQKRRKQESRQLANVLENELLHKYYSIISKEINKKYNDILSNIQEIDCLNKEKLEKGKNQMRILEEIREKVTMIDNSLV